MYVFILSYSLESLWEEVMSVMILNALLRNITLFDIIIGIRLILKLHICVSCG